MIGYATFSVFSTITAKTPTKMLTTIVTSTYADIMNWAKMWNAVISTRIAR